MDEGMWLNKRETIRLDTEEQKNKGLWQTAKAAPNLPIPSLHLCNPGVFVISPSKGWNLDLHH